MSNVLFSTEPDRMTIVTSDHVLYGRLCAKAKCRPGSKHAALRVLGRVWLLEGLETKTGKDFFRCTAKLIAVRETAA